MRLFRRLLLVLVALWLVGEIVAIPVANGIIAKDVAARTRDATTVKASVGTFPVVARMILLQKVNSVSVTLEHVAGQAIPFAEIRYNVHDVGIDRSSLFNGKVHVTSVGSGTVTATIDVGDLGIVGRVIGAAVHMEGRTLMLGGRGITITSNLIPCTPTASVGEQQIVLSCSITHVPPVLLENLQR